MFESKYEDKSDYDNSICPYCEESYQVETEDYDEDKQEIKCEGCGMKYYLHQVFSVEHQTSPDCELNGLEHQFELVQLRNGGEAEFCLICYKCRIPRAELKELK